MIDTINDSTQIIINDTITSFVSTGDEKRINIKYYFNKTNNHVYAEIIFGDLAQGPPGFVHGGAIASVLDEAMGITAWMNNLKVMTRELNISFYKAIKLNSKVYVKAWVESSGKNSAVIKSKMVSSDEVMNYADAEGRFAILDEEKWKAFGIDASKFISDDYLQSEE